MRRVALRFYPIFVVAFLLNGADTNWPDTYETSALSDYGSTVGSSIVDFVSTLLAPMDFSR